jgi:hypothetical protein
MQSPQPLHHLQFFTPQQQQPLLQAQQTMTSPVDMDSRRLQMLYGNQNLVPGRDVQSNPFTEIIPSGGLSLQNIGSTAMQFMESDLLIKVGFASMHVISVYCVLLPPFTFKCHSRIQICSQIDVILTSQYNFLSSEYISISISISLVLVFCATHLFHLSLILVPRARMAVKTERREY